MKESKPPCQVVVGTLGKSLMRNKFLVQLTEIHWNNPMVFLVNRLLSEHKRKINLAMVTHIASSTYVTVL